MEQKFIYRGKDIQEPLEELVDFYDIQYQSTLSELKNLKAPKQNSLQLIGDTEEQRLYRTLESKYKSIIINHKKASNWLREAKRTPRKQWELDFIDLDWLYRPKTFYEIPGSY